MKKFTFIAMLLVAFCATAKAEMMDKYFFKIPTDKFSSSWVVQDASNFVGTPGKEYLTAQNKKNGGRMLNYFWNEEAWEGVDVNNLLDNTYKFTMDLNMSTMYAKRSDMEFVLLPVGACTSTDERVATHNAHWWNANEGDDYFFRWRVGEAPTATNGNYTIWINENPTAKNDWTQTTDETLELASQKTYKFSVEINVVAKTASYTIADEDGNVLKQGVHNYTCTENRAGIMVFSMNGSSTHLLSNMGLSYQVDGPFANDPTVELLGVIGDARAYYVTFAEGETLYWNQLGNSIYDDSHADGEECSVSYTEANDTREFDTSTDVEGAKIVWCGKSGELKLWTVLDANGSKSNDVVENVTCETVTMPTPTATITNVEEGYVKEYQLSVDNSETLLTPEVTINYVVKDASGNVTSSGGVLTGEKITLTSPGTIEMYGCDGKHEDNPWYTQSKTVTITNNVEYQKALYTDYAWTKSECDNTKEGFTVTEIVDNGNKSHWDRIYSDQAYGYDENGNATAYVDGTTYAGGIKKGFGFYPGTSIATDDAKWNVQVPDDATTAFSPLVPTESFTSNSKYDKTAWGIFPLEGIVYYNTAVNYAVFGIDSKYVSDDTAKPNFYIVHTRGGYDRPDKGDCNATTVCVAGEDYSLNRYDTAICDVTVMTYKGFVPGSGISTVNASETAAPAVKKVLTKNGLVIVKGNKTYSVSGAQVK